MELIWIVLSCGLLLQACFGAYLTRKDRKILDKCCGDYPTCGASDPWVTAAVFNPQEKGREQLYVFYENYVFPFTFKDEARNTPMLQQSIDNSYKVESDWKNIGEVELGYSTNSEMFFLLKEANKDETLYSFNNERKKGSPPDMKLHPWLDDQRDGNMYTAALMRAHGKSGSILAFYRKQDNPGSAPFDYTIKLWDIETRTVKFKATDRGYLIAAAGRRILRSTDEQLAPSRGLYFTSDGRVCEFELAHEPQINIKIELKRSHGGGSLLTPPCSSVSVYLGCPPSFCYEANVDDIASHMDHYYVFREAFFWKVKGKKLPMAAPTKEMAFHLDSSKDMKQGITQIDAAFSYTENNTDILVTMKENMVKYYMNGQLVTRETDILSEIFKGVKAEALVDTAVYSKELGKLMMFLGEKWAYFKRDPSDPDSWNLDGSFQEKADTFEELPLHFDGSLDYEGNLYFLVGSFYYKMRAEENPSVKVFTASASIVSSTEDGSGIFHTANCPQESKHRIASRYQEFMPSKGSMFMKAPEEPKEEGYGNLDIYLTLVGTILVVAFVILLGAFFFAAKRRSSSSSSSNGRSSNQKTRKTFKKTR